MQTQVYTEMALGKAGLISRQTPCPEHLPFVAEGDDLVAGAFCFEGTDAEKTVVGKKADATKVAGLVIFEKLQPRLHGLADGMKINAGEEVAVLLKGCAYITAPEAVVKGDKIGVNPATGETIKFVEEDAYSIDTGFVVLTGANAGDTCEIMKL